MAYLEPYLTSSVVGKLNLQGAEINFSWQNNIASPDIPSKFPTNKYTIGEVDFLGWENPKITVQGIFDAVSSPTFFNNLIAITRATSSATIYDPVFFTSGTQKIRIETLSFSRQADEGISQTSSDYIKGSLVRYNLTATLTE